MFSKKKKKIEISAPSNFQHRVHTGFDSHSNKFVGLPKQWASLVDDKPANSSPYRPSPMIDPSSYTDVPEVHQRPQNGPQNGSSVVRSNSLRSNSPPQFRRHKPLPPNLPPVPESEHFGRNFRAHPMNQVPVGMMSNRSSVSSEIPPPLQRPMPSNGGYQPQAYRVQPPQRSQGPPSRPVSVVPDESVVPGGTNVIAGYDPATGKPRYFHKGIVRVLQMWRIDCSNPFDLMRNFVNSFVSVTISLATLKFCSDCHRMPCKLFCCFSGVEDQPQSHSHCKYLFIIQFESGER